LYFITSVVCKMQSNDESKQESVSGDANLAASAAEGVKKGLEEGEVVGAVVAEKSTDTDMSNKKSETPKPKMKTQSMPYTIKAGPHKGQIRMKRGSLLRNDTRVRRGVYVQWYRKQTSPPLDLPTASSRVALEIKALPPGSPMPWDTPGAWSGGNEDYFASTESLLEKRAAEVEAAAAKVDGLSSIQLGAGKGGSSGGSNKSDTTSDSAARLANLLARLESAVQKAEGGSGGGGSGIKKASRKTHSAARKAAEAASAAAAVSDTELDEEDGFDADSLGSDNDEEVVAHITSSSKSKAAGDKKKRVGSKLGQKRKRSSSSAPAPAPAPAVSSAVAAVDATPAPV
jgi:hypothetical protein